MPDTVSLSARILTILGETGGALTVNDIVTSLLILWDLHVTAQEVLNELHGPLAGQVANVGEGRWARLGKDEIAPSLPLFPAEGSAAPNDAAIAPTTDLSPSCPRCGEPMKLRIARRGPNAGNRFYGCSRFPNCRGTLEAQAETGERAHPTTYRRGARNQAVRDYPLFPEAVPLEPNSSCPHSGDAASAVTHPRRLAAYPSTVSTVAIYFECAALPREAIRSSLTDTLPSSYQHALCQWQLDSPRITGNRLSRPPAWLAVVEKILRRGHAVPLSPALERELQALADPHFAASEQWEEIAIQVAVAPRHVPHWTYGFGSDEERLFVEQVLPAICPDSLLGWLQRQVSLDALIGADESRPSNRRVDFLIAHPSGAQLVVEIDGAQHADQLTADANRDADLHAAGYEVFRIPVQEVRSGAGVELDRLRHRLQHIPLDASQPPHGRLFTLIRRAHQLQLALWYAVATGMRPANGDSPISVIVDLGDDFDEATAQRFADAVLRDLNALIADVASLYEDVGCRFTVAADSVGSVFVRFTADYSAPTPNTLYVRDIYLPFPIGIESPASVTTADITASERVCERLLERIFGYDTFREGQFAAIERCLRGKDAIVLLPTGAGKSIAFQLSAILRPGICIVVAPLISLIDDQIENLRTFGIDRACQITSASNWEEQRLILAQLGRGEYLFCYVAPERFQNQRFRDALRLLTTHTAVSLVAIDEAHCISEWGHDFRPAYLNLARISREYCAFDGVSPPLMALTGTASRAVLKDMQRELQIEDFEAIITPSSFDRPEIRFEVLSCRSNEKLSRLQGVLEVLPRKFGRTASDFFGCSGEHTASGLIFCPHVRGDFGILRVSQELANRMRQQVLLYGSRPPIGVPEDTWQTQRANMARQFKRNHAAVMACTSSFGMGIDKPNIRYTVHFGVPKSIEAFYQEAGRAGRDRNDAYCIILYSNDAPVRTQQLLSPAASIEALQEHLKSVPRRDGDDITRSLWFHTNAFSGIEADHNAVCRLIDEIGSLENPRNVVVEFSGSDRDARERAVYRLLTIGVVSDYTVDHASRTFQVRLSGASNHDILESIYQYVATYQRQQAQVIADRLREQMSLAGQEFARISARQLIEFVYEVIESSRRQALSEMVALCEIGANEAAFRERLLAYLGTSSFSGAIDRILESDGAGLAEAIQVLREVRSPFDAVQLRGESGRALEAYPNHAGLRLVRGAAEALTASPDRVAVSENTEASVRFAIERHGMGQHAVLTDIVAAALLVSEVETELAQLIITGAMRGAKDQRVAARQLAQELPRPLSDCALATLLDKLNRQVLKLLEGRE